MKGTTVTMKIFSTMRKLMVVITSKTSKEKLQQHQQQQQHSKPETKLRTIIKIAMGIALTKEEKKVTAEKACE